MLCLMLCWAILQCAILGRFWLWLYWYVHFLATASHLNFCISSPANPHTHCSTTCCIQTGEHNLVLRWIHSCLCNKGQTPYYGIKALYIAAPIYLFFNLFPPLKNLVTHHPHMHTHYHNHIQTLFNLCSFHLELPSVTSVHHLLALL